MTDNEQYGRTDTVQTTSTVDSRGPGAPSKGSKMPYAMHHMPQGSMLVIDEHTRVPVPSDRGSEGVHRAKSLTEEEKKDQREKLSFMQRDKGMPLATHRSVRMQSNLPSISQINSTSVSSKDYNYKGHAQGGS